MDVVPHLLALVAVNLVLLAFHVALDQVAEEAVQLHAGVVRPRQAPAAQATGGHVEVPAVLLHQHIRGELGGAEQRMLRLIDGQGLGDAVPEIRIVVLPARGQLRQSDAVRRVSVHLVRGHVDERRIQAVPPRRLQQVERSHGIRIEILEGDRGGAVMRGLSRRVDDHRRPGLGDHRIDPGPVAHVHLVMVKARKAVLQPPLVPARVALGAEEDRPLVVVDAMDFEPALAEIQAHLGSDQPVGTGDEDSLGH